MRSDVVEGSGDGGHHHWDHAESRKFTLADQQMLAQLADHAAIARGERQALRVASEQLVERGRAEETLRAANNLAAAVLVQLNEAVIITDPCNRIIEDCNRTFESVFGYRREEVTGKPTSILHVDEAAFVAFRSFLAKWDVVADGASFEFVMKPRTVRCSIGALCDPLCATTPAGERCWRHPGHHRAVAGRPEGTRPAGAGHPAENVAAGFAAGDSGTGGKGPDWRTAGPIADLATEITQADMCTIQLKDQADYVWC